jgi:hypothetical protein
MAGKEKPKSIKVTKPKAGKKVGVKKPKGY